MVFDATLAFYDVSMGTHDIKRAEQLRDVYILSHREKFKKKVFVMGLKSKVASASYKDGKEDSKAEQHSSEEGVAIETVLDVQGSQLAIWLY